ncbi:hypothetical protein VTJ83DRAFT_733 [Remersonia thermophila]|uniref:Uncharacterized protein n=1 Tax=Remersonia thermophila TaxID=72144 RepID=A0ABR4DM93_9PEZI
MGAQYALPYSLISLIFALLFVVSCSSEREGHNRLYEVNVARLAENLKANALRDSGREVTPLVPPELLPAFWNFGLSAGCPGARHLRLFQRDKPGVLPDRLGEIATHLDRCRRLPSQQPPPRRARSGWGRGQAYRRRGGPGCPCLLERDARQPLSVRPPRLPRRGRFSDLLDRGARDSGGRGRLLDPRAAHGAAVAADGVGPPVPGRRRRRAGGRGVRNPGVPAWHGWSAGREWKPPPYPTVGGHLAAAGGVLGPIVPWLQVRSGKEEQETDEPGRGRAPSWDAPAGFGALERR